MEPEGSEDHTSNPYPEQKQSNSSLWRQFFKKFHCNIYLEFEFILEFRLYCDSIYNL